MGTTLAKPGHADSQTVCGGVWVVSLPGWAVVVTLTARSLSLGASVREFGVGRNCDRGSCPSSDDLFVLVSFPRRFGCLTLPSAGRYSRVPHLCPNRTARKSHRTDRGAVEGGCQAGQGRHDLER